MRTITIYERPTGAVQVELYLTRLEAERLRWLTSHSNAIASQIARLEYRTGPEHSALQNAIHAFVSEIRTLFNDMPELGLTNPRELWHFGDGGVPAPDDQQTEQIQAQEIPPLAPELERYYTISSWEPELNEPDVPADTRPPRNR